MSDAERKRLMKTRNRMRKKRPHFTQFESWRLIRIKDHWKRPKGIDNHMRQQKRGWPKVVKVGYGSPKIVRGLHPSGLEEVMVYTIADLALIDPETQIARLGGSVGKKNRIAILKEAHSQDIKILNIGKAKGLVELEPIEEYLENNTSDTDNDENKEGSE